MADETTIRNYYWMKDPLFLSSKLNTSFQQLYPTKNNKRKDKRKKKVVVHYISVENRVGNGNLVDINDSLFMPLNLSGLQINGFLYLSLLEP